MAGKPSSVPPQQLVYRVKEAFAVPDGDGVLRTYTAGKLISGSDSLAKTHRALLEPVADAVEKATAAPGERRALRLPSGVRLQQATEHNTGQAHTTGEIMAHNLPPEDPDSPASPFAPGQPALGVVADDVPEVQNPAGGTKAADAPASEAIGTPNQVKDAEAEPAKP